MRSRTSKGLVALVVTAISFGVFASQATAAYDEYYNGWLTGAITAPPHHLTKNSARSLSGGIVCVQAYWPDGPRAGTPDCAQGVNALAATYYNAVALLVGATSARTVDLRARVDF